MTFHAPQSNTRLVSIVARRVLLGRVGLIAAALVTTTVVLAGRGEEPAIRAIKADDGGQVSRLGLSQYGLDKTFEVASLTLRAVPDALKLPRHRDQKITSRLYSNETDAPNTQTPAKPALDPLLDAKLLDTDADTGGESPNFPKAKDVQIASLTPTNLDWSSVDVAPTPRMPALGPIAIMPSAALPEADLIPDLGDADTLPTVVTLAAEANETLEQMLARGDLSDEDYQATLVALRADDISQSLMEGDMIDLALLSEDDNQLLAIRMRQLGQLPVELRWDSDTTPLWPEIVATEPGVIEAASFKTTTPKEQSLSVTGRDNDTRFIAGEINSSLYASAKKAGLTPAETKTLSNIFRYSVDFERDLRKGDRFEAMFERGQDGTSGTILYAKLTNRGSEIALYHGVDDVTGEAGYFDATGKTNKRSLMRTPVAGAQVSSHFGMRHHPVLGYNKMHRGTDFRAHTGTPIFAAGDGIVDYLGRNGAYGKYIRIRHNSVYETAYAHMSRYANGLVSGARVRQGDVIGYVGSTGRSTGPHLHFEILEHGNQINPLQVADFGPTRGLTGAALSAFKVRVSRIEIALTLMQGGSRVATVE